MKSSDYMPRQPQHLLIYGEPGTKKSRMAMELAVAGFKLKYFCIDGGIPLKGQPQHALDNTEVFILRDTSSFQVGIRTLKEIVRGGDFNLCDYHGHVNCPNCATAGQPFSRVNVHEMQLDEILVIDHLTAMSISALNTVWKGEVYAASDVPADDTTSFNIWRQQGWLITDILTRCQNAPFNTCFIAMEIMSKMDDGSKKIVPNIGTTNLAADSAGFFDHVVHCDKVNGEIKFTSLKNTSAIVKSRDNISIEAMKIPSLVPFYPPLGTVREKLVVVSDGKITKPNISLNTAIKKIDSSTVETKVTVPDAVQSDKLAAMRAKLGKK